MWTSSLEIKFACNKNIIKTPKHFEMSFLVALELLAECKPEIYGQTTCLVIWGRQRWVESAGRLESPLLTLYCKNLPFLGEAIVEGISTLQCNLCKMLVQLTYIMAKNTLKIFFLLYYVEVLETTYVRKILLSPCNVWNLCYLEKKIAW